MTTLLIYTCVALSGILIGVLVWPYPRALVGLALLSILFARTVAHFEPAIGGSLDDAATILVVLRACVYLFERGRRPFLHYPGLLAFLLFGLMGIVSGLANDVSPVLILSGTYLAMKGIFFGLACAQFEWNFGHVNRGYRFWVKLAVPILLLGLVNLAVPGMWARLFSVNGGAIERYGLPSVHSVFIHPYDFAFFCSMTGVMIIAWSIHHKSSVLERFVLVGTVVGTVLSFRRKDLVGFVFAGLSINVRHHKYFALALAFVGISLVIVVEWDFIFDQFEVIRSGYFSMQSKEARTILTLGALSVAANHFPLGAGFGRFGSRIAALNYSPEYVDLGYVEKYGLGPGAKGFFLTDTSWPAIIGETGLIGTLAFVLGLVICARFAWRLSRNSESGLSTAGSITFAWLILATFQSLGAAVFSAPPTFPFVFTAVGISAALARRATTQPRRHIEETETYDSNEGS